MTKHITQENAVALVQKLDVRPIVYIDHGEIERLCNAAIQHWIDSQKMVLPDPIGYMEFRFGTRYLHFADSKPYCAGQPHTKPLYTADQMAQAVALAKVVPDGFKLVPVDPTSEMIDAAFEGMVTDMDVMRQFARRRSVIETYGRMIAAATSTGGS